MPAPACPGPAPGVPAGWPRRAPACACPPLARLPLSRPQRPGGCQEASLSPGLPHWPPASLLGSGELRRWASSLLVRLTLFCFEFLGLSLVDKGKQTPVV